MKKNIKMSKINTKKKETENRAINILNALRNLPEESQAFIDGFVTGLYLQKKGIDETIA